MSALIDEAVANGKPSELKQEEDDATHNGGDEDEDAMAEMEGGRPATCSSSRANQPKKASLGNPPFPLARVKRLIKNEDDMRISSEATYVISKGVGLFLEKFVEHSFEHMIDGRRHSLTYKDLATHVSRAKRFDFLADFVPEKLTAVNALSVRAEQET